MFKMFESFKKKEVGKKDFESALTEYENALAGLALEDCKSVRWLTGEANRFLFNERESL